MSDMTLCTSFECPSRLDCFRSQYKPNPLHQSYANLYVPGVECVEFILLEDEDANV